jgi:inward rectifier potassium channel
VATGQLRENNRAMARTPTSPSGNQLSYSFQVVGAPGPEWRDAYHAMLRMPVWGALGILVGGYLVLNAVFAAIYMAIGGIDHAEHGSFLDAFFFSVQTMGTIGYGAMSPSSRAANVVVVCESVVGLLVTAVATGFVFVRFSRIRARLVFSEKVAIGPLDGVPTLMIRVGNARRNRIFDADLRLTLARTRKSAEGVTIYKNEDLKLVRSHAPTLMSSFMMLHPIDEESPLQGVTPEQLAGSEAELTLAITGTDDTALQTVHGRFTWESKDIVYGARLADVLSETPSGDMLLDLSKFHELVPTTPVAGFPYPKTNTLP